MELQKGILSLTGNLKFKENSRVEKSIPQCPTLSEAMSASEKEEKNLFSGLGTKVWVGTKDSFFKKGSGLYQGDWKEHTVPIDLSDSKGNDDNGISSSENDNPFKRGFSLKLDFDDEDHLRSACELAKCVLPYSSKLPYFVRFKQVTWDTMEFFSLKKPWRFYNLPKLYIYHIPIEGEIHILLNANGEGLGEMTSAEYAHCLSNKVWAERMKR